MVFMNKKNIFKNILLFIIGFCLYITIEVLFRSYSYPLMGVVGGISLIIVDKINDRISWDMPLILQCIIGGLIITILELLSGEFALHILNVRMWDYSGMWLSSFDNLLCPLFSFFWCLLACVGIILADAINYYVIHIEPRPYYVILNKKYFLPENLCTEHIT